jgi:cyclic pyranopterin phosphate synthase
MSFSHFDEGGAARMVDVGSKAPTHRRARASVVVRMEEATLRAILEHRVEKGDVFEIARLAGIMAAKRTPELIPLCHQIPLSSVGLTFEPRGGREVLVTAEARAHAVTGVEMEALTACSVAALTIYDMCKALDRAMVIGELKLEEKRGGKSDFLAPGAGGAAA